MLNGVFFGFGTPKIGGVGGTPPPHPYTRVPREGHTGVPVPYVYSCGNTQSWILLPPYHLHYPLPYIHLTSQHIRTLHGEKGANLLQVERKWGGMWRPKLRVGNTNLEKPHMNCPWGNSLHTPAPINYGWGTRRGGVAATDSQRGGARAFTLPTGGGGSYCVGLHRAWAASGVRSGHDMRWQPVAWHPWARSRSIKPAAHPLNGWWDLSE